MSKAGMLLGLASLFSFQSKMSHGIRSLGNASKPANLTPKQYATKRRKEKAARVARSAMHAQRRNK